MSKIRKHLIKQFVRNHEHVYSMIPTLAILSCFSLLFIFNFHNTWDDSFISYRYAKNFNEFGALTYNGPDRTEGYSNFLLVMLMAFFMKFNVSPVISSKLIGLISGLGSILLVGRMFTLLFPDFTSFKYVPMLILATSFGYSIYSAVGLETTLFSFLIIMGSYVLVKAIRTGRYGKLWIPFILVILCRPEGFVFIPILLVIQLVIRLINKNEKNSGVALYLITLTLLTVLYFIWKKEYFGMFFPSTYYAKVPSDTLANIKSGILYSLEFIKTNVLETMILFAGLVIGALRVKRDGISRELVGVILLFLGYWGYIVVVGGDHGPFPGFRSFMYLYPLFALLIGVALLKILNSIKIDYRSKLIAAGLIISVISVLNIFVGFKAFDTLHQNGFIEYVRKGYSVKPPLTVHRQVGEYLKENVPADEYIAVSEAGTIPYYAERNTIDYLGLNNQEIAMMFYERKSPAEIAAFILDKKPYAIVTLGYSDLRENQIIARFPLDQAIYDNKIFKNEYHMPKKICS